MVMGFQDEIDEDDFLETTGFGNPVAQVSDSSDEEPSEILQPLPKAPLIAPMKVNNIVENLTAEDDLDDWLNGSEEPSISTVSIQKLDNVRPSESQIKLEPERMSSPDEPAPDVIAKSKKHKEKKSKRKSKKSSRESSEMDGNSPQQTRPNNDYEEI